METLLLYFGKMILCSAVMFGYYFVFLKDKTFHHYNRFYLLSILFFSLFLPLIKIDYFTIEVNPDLFLLLKNFQTIPTKIPTQNDFNSYLFIISAFGLVSAFFILKFLFGLIKIQHLKKQFPKTEFEGIKFYETPLEEAPFSFFRNLFWKNSIELQSDLGRQILKHEMVHIEQKHTWDKIIITSVISIVWFNPIFYLIKKEIILIHEYLADKKTVKESDTRAFAQMLLASHFTGTSLPATSPFLNSNLKKRIIMLKKSHTKFSYLRKISALPLIFLLAFAYLVNAKNREISKTNEVIAKAVSQINKNKTDIKKDTIRDELNQNIKNADEKESDSLKFISNNKVEFNNSKIEEISKKIASKTNELMQLKTDSKDFTLKQKEISGLGKELNKVLNSISYQNLAENAKIEGMKARAFVNSKEFKKQMAKAKLEAKKAQDYVNSPEFKKQIEDVKRQAKEVAKNSEYFKNEAEKLKAETNDLRKTVAIENPNSNKNPNQNNPWILNVEAHSPSNLIDPNIKYYLNGKLTDSSVMKNIPPNTIKSINVEKKPGDKKAGSIYIITKDESFETNPILYQKIYINGKLSTQSELDKLKKEDIKTENIKKNTENGKSYNEIRIRTK